MFSLRVPVIFASVMLVGATLASCKQTGDTETTGTVHSCTDLCTLYFANCSTYQTKFADEAACEADCPTTQGTVGDQSGDSIECRYYHATQASEDDHCDEADGDQTCI